MKFDHSFNHHDVSQALMSYVEEKMQRLTKYEIKPCNAHVRYSVQRHLCHVEIHLAGGEGRFQANHDERDWHMAVDGAVQKLERQMKKLKSRIKGHKHHRESKEGRLHLVTPELETDYSRLEGFPTNRKVG